MSGDVWLEEPEEPATRVPPPGYAQVGSNVRV